MVVGWVNLRTMVFRRVPDVFSAALRVSSVAQSGDPSCRLGEEVGWGYRRIMSEHLVSLRAVKRCDTRRHSSWTVGPLPHKCRRRRGHEKCAAHTRAL
jgi:hypothetical protein